MQRIRRAGDGTYWLAKADKETENYLDGKYQRLPNELKWRSKSPSIIGAYANIYKGTICKIFGKGPSLDNIELDHFSFGEPVIALNEAIHKVEEVTYELSKDIPIYGSQLDYELGEVCKPRDAKLFLGPRCANLYETDVHTIRIDPCSLGLHDTCLSAQFAIMMARHMGCTAVEMWCFDGCVGNEFEYARCVGRDSGEGGSKLRFASHKPLILQTAKNITLSWKIPKADGIIETTLGL